MKVKSITCELRLENLTLETMNPQLLNRIILIHLSHFMKEMIMKNDNSDQIITLKRN